MNLYKLIPSICLTGFLLSLAGILFAPALASVGMILCILAGVVSWDKKSWKQNQYLLLPPILVLWLVLSSKLHGWTADTGRLLLLKLPLLFFPFLACATKALDDTRRYWALTAWVWMLYAAAGASLLVYFRDASWYHQLVLESKPMPVLARMHHIEFSLFLASSVWAGMALWLLPVSAAPLGILRRFTLFAAGL
ncbi:MAG: hypothetical protein KJS92_09490, partial [Bacteroidetes bacterium]|nr:hypothetical protein [Bacteroidota bacterium]